MNSSSAQARSSFGKIRPHTIIALVEDRPGVLNRIASKWRQRGFNIESLAVGHSEKHGLSRMTFVVDADTNAEQVVRQLDKLIDVVHIRDVSHEDTEAQSRDVEEVLSQLGIAERGEGRLLEVWNKIDLLASEARVRVRNQAERQRAVGRPVLVSARSGEGLDRLVVEIEQRLAADRITLEFLLDAADGAGLSWLHRHTEVMSKALREDGVLAITVRADPANAQKARAKFARASIHSH